MGGTALFYTLLSNIIVSPLPPIAHHAPMMPLVGTIAGQNLLYYILDNSRNEWFNDGSLKRIILSDDVLVSKTSASAVGFYNPNNNIDAWTKIFMIDNVNPGVAIPSSPSVPHNSIPLDIDTLNRIVSNITMGTVLSITHSGNAVRIDGANATIKGDIDIPEQVFLDGQYFNVAAIGVSAFANQTGLTSVTLSNVTTIGNSAFSGCSNLTSISELSNVADMGNLAFAECSKLTAVSFGTNSVLETIKERTFYNTGLRSFAIPTNVANIEDEAFLGTAITSFIGNANYVWQDNVLIKYNVTNTDKKIAIYVNPTLSSISFPNTVAILNSNLLKDNANIQTVYLNQVEYIGPEAFRNSALENLFNSSNIIDCNLNAVLDTPWYENSTDVFVILGKVLLKYRGIESIVKIPENVFRIGADCFENSNITQVVLSEQIDSLGYASLSGLTSLESVLFTSDLPPMLDGNCFNDNVILYVKESRLAEYKNNINFINLPNTITKLPVAMAQMQPYPETMVAGAVLVFRPILLR